MATPAAKRSRIDGRMRQLRTDMMPAPQSEDIDNELMTIAWQLVNYGEGDGLGISPAQAVERIKALYAS